MIISRTVVLTVVALVIGFLAARWSFAQPAELPPQTKNQTQTTTYWFHQLESFVCYLNDTKQTNTLQRFNDYSNVSIVSRSSADLGVKLHILYALRSGRTNEVIRLLELQMTSDVVGFAAGYRELPAPIREKVGLTEFREARDYCHSYSVSSERSVVMTS